MTDEPRHSLPLVSSPHLAPTASENITFFLGYMQRRLSTFAADPLSFRRSEGDNQDLRRHDTSSGAEGPLHEGSDPLNHQTNESPSLHRGGLLQPKSYNASHSMMPASLIPDSVHTPDSIRAATVELSSMEFPGSVPSGGPGLGSLRSLHLPPSIQQGEPAVTEETTPAFIFPRTLPGVDQNADPSRTSSTSSLGLDHEPDQTSLVSHSMSSSFLRDVPSSRASASGSGSGLDSSIATSPPTGTPDKRPRTTADKKKPSGISLLKPSGSPDSPSPASSSRSSSLSSTRSGRPQTSGIPEISFSPIAVSDSTPTASPMGTPRPPQQGLPPTAPPPNRVHWRSPVSPARQLSPSMPSTPASYSTLQPDGPVVAHTSSDETTPLLSHHTRLSDAAEIPRTSSSALHQKGGLFNGNGPHIGDEEEGWGARTFFAHTAHNVKSMTSKHQLHTNARAVATQIKTELSKAPEHASTAVKAIPAVLLGSLLNILDGVSYGMILFPATGVFADLGPMGVSIFFVTAVVAQLVYTFGGSGFAGANGSMMIEVVPFFHILANSIAAEIGEDEPLAIIATTLVAYALSSILTGLSFFLLGALKLGVVVGFFPRHILVGCIGGVGAFLIETGLTVSMRIPDEDFTMTWETFEFMFLDTHNLVLWTLPLALAILLRVITHKYHHQLIFPLYFIIIPIIFYIVVFAAGLDLTNLRHTGWVFDMGASANEPWYKFYSYYDFGLVRYSALWSTLPTQFALLFFNILHPPLNVPALAVSLNNDLDTNKELVAHGYSNLLAGVFGVVPNYLVYVNTLLFYRVGGDNRIAGFLLAIATAALLVVGSGPIAFIPVMVVGALIFVLGIDLVIEALWDTRHRVTWSEYITIISIMVCMTVWDFVIGVLFGIIVCCFFFVVQNSQLRSIRAMYTGDLAVSAVRRPSLQRAYIQEVSKQTTILRLQGFLFFGTITYVEETIRSLLEGPYWHVHPIQFLVVDLSLVAGVDMSSAEAFVRIQRLLSGKRVTIVFCGFTIESPIGKALRSVDVLGADGVELFGTFGDAMEWTENAYLRAWFCSQKIETPARSFLIPGHPDSDIEYSHLVGSFVRSPRRSQIRDAGDRTIATELVPQSQPDVDSQLFNTLSKAFSSCGSLDPILFRPIGKYLERMSVSEGYVLWEYGDPADALYIIESGLLRATYKFAHPGQHFEESMVGGTVAGEMTALADSPRNATAVAEHPSVLWKFSKENIQKIQNEEPELARVFIQFILKNAKIDYDILLSAMALRH